jgi:hypothetical protein
MARGNQRDMDRAKAQKKAVDANKGNSTVKAKESTAEIMRQKQAAAEAKKAEAAAGGQK